jgi:hypothetical protein
VSISVRILLLHTGLVCVMLLLGLFFWLRTKRFVDESVRVTGVVVGLVRKKSKGHGTFSPRVRFTTADGREVEFTEMWSSYPPRFKVGDSAIVLYHRRNPGRARVLTSRWLLYFPALITGGLGLLFAGVLLLLSAVYAVAHFTLGPPGR